MQSFAVDLKSRKDNLHATQDFKIIRGNSTSYENRTGGPVIFYSSMDSFGQKSPSVYSNQNDEPTINHTRSPLQASAVGLKRSLRDSAKTRSSEPEGRSSIIKNSAPSGDRTLSGSPSQHHFHK